MILLIRVLIIGSFSLAGDRLFSQDTARPRNSSRPVEQPIYRPTPTQSQSQPAPAIRSASSLNRPAAPQAPSTPNTFRPAPKPNNPNQPSSFVRPEPTYHNLSFNGPSNDRSATDRNYDA
jgi:hypothetical protein